MWALCGMLLKIVCLESKPYLEQNRLANIKMDGCSVENSNFIAFVLILFMLRSLLWGVVWIDRERNDGRAIGNMGI